MPELPRITRALRTFTALGRIKSTADLEPNDLFKKQQEQLKSRHSRFTWQDFYKHVPMEVQAKLNMLREITEKVFGECSSELINEFLMFVLRLLIDDRHLSNEKFAMLSEKAKNLKFSDANKILKIIKEIRETLNSDMLMLIANEDKHIDNDGIFKSELFDPKFEYTPAKVLWPNTDMLSSMLPKDSTSDKGDFLIKIVGEATQQLETKFDKETYKKCLMACYSKYKLLCTLEEFETSIISKLENHTHTQNELLDFLGFENIENMQYFIQNRKYIIALRSAPKVQKSYNDKGPMIASQVIVQSKKEKQLYKQVQKQEKKLGKIANKQGGKGETSEHDNERLELYLKKQEALVEMRKPLLRNDFVHTRSAEPRYPFVFDSNRNSKNKISYVSKQNVMLPETVVREDTDNFEKVLIPITTSESCNVDYKPVLVSSLDEIGQQAFEGIESLNRIQSIVFDAAYGTNENLLICAPTGAGKTNIGMLTVVHQLRQYIEHGEIMKDKFKIIYVAPMKALAAEITANFSRRLQRLGISVCELTGDMQLTKREIQQTQMIVTTPEKWDVVTRKGIGDTSLTGIVKLLIIDEVHLLHSDRGPVVEALVARTLRQVESSQSMIRIVGLSATLPNYLDVARFLRVNPYVGLFYFDYRFRPVPLSQTFIGVKVTSPLEEMNAMDEVCYDNVINMLRGGHQAMVFVHARNATVRVANALKNLAQQDGTLKYFVSEGRSKFSGKPFAKSRNNILSELFDSGISVHHAGLSRMDRNLVEKYFSDGLVKVLVCTSTLAWGVNLPAHAVIIRGTEIYDAKYGSYIDLDILDVLQIFGRAGRPQFDTSGHAVIITSHGKLYHYLKLLTNQIPIESNFIKYLADNLNAEIALGTISNVKEAIEWLSYTYLFVRMKLNPLVYGMNHQDVSGDPNLEMKRQKLIDTAASALDKAKMIRYNEQTGDFSTTDLGRIASHFYLKYDTIEIFNQLIKPIMTEANIFAMVSHSQEFEQIKVRDDEMNELDNLFECCEITVQGGVENIYGKVNILLQTYLSRGFLNSFSLMSDQAYIVSNVVRICRALFKIMLGQNNAIMSARLLEISKMFEAQQWSYKHPLHQFSCLSVEVIDKLDRYNLTIDRLKDMDIKEIGDILRNQKIAALVKKCCEELPVIEMESNSQPITRTVLRIRLKIYPQFRWNDNVHGKTSSEPFWIWIEDPESNFIYHYEYYCVTRKMVYGQQEDELVMTIPLREPLPSQYIVKATSDRWLGCESTLSLTFHDLILPEDYPPHTDLLKLQPLPVKALQETAYENLYQFSHFNPIQTQLFHCLYHTDNNVLLGAPTGSGKTIVAEIAMFRIFKQYPSQKIVYIAPLKALVRERMKDWKVRLEQKLGKKVIELTGDVSPDVRAIASTNVIVTTPEKWDGISRSWQTRDYVKNTGLVIIDEIHLLGEDRGPVLEVIISRTNFISSHTSRKLRIVGLSTALANAVDLAHWLGIRDMGLYNFRPSVRPVPLEIHVNGFPGKHYCPRMATMNKPTFQAIRQHAPNSPSLVFVSSRRQTRLTALDLISYLAAEDDSKQWLHMPNEEMNSILEQIRDTNLKLTLAFGIGLHHAGLQDKDKQIVEELFFHNKIQVLVTTATLAWGVNFPAHLVVIKGTEYYDGKTKKYVDMPITDVLQMMGRAGRPQFDDSAVAVVLVHDVKKDFYKKFLHEPFPVESSLLAVLPDHINAEIVAGTIRNKQEFLDYLTWTYFFRRLMKNPKYYNLCDLEPVVINGYLSSLVDDTLKVLLESRCIDFNEEEQILYSLPMGNIASYYYLSYRTISMFGESLRDNLTLEQYLHILCDSYEYDELPVRHNEDILNEELSKMCRYRADNYSYNSPHTKTFLLLQAHFSRLPMPCADYVTDLKSVLDQAVRIVQAMINIVAEQGWLYSTLMITNLLQMIIQARWIDECAITTLPYIDSQYLQLFNTLCLPALCASMYNKYELLMETLGKEFQEEQIRQIYMVIRRMPMINVDLSVELCGEITNRQKISLRPNNLMCISIHKDQEYILNIGLKRIHKCDSLKVHSPQFQKGKDEGWFLVFGDIPNRTLFAFKRVSSLKEQWKQHHLQFTAPSELGETTLTFFLMSDCYLGLDQQYDIQVNVIP